MLRALEGPGNFPPASGKTSQFWGVLTVSCFNWTVSHVCNPNAQDTEARALSPNQTNPNNSKIYLISVLWRNLNYIKTAVAVLNRNGCQTVHT